MNESINDLKHSIRNHLLIMGGPSQQLCAFLIKTIDLLEDDDQIRKEADMRALSYNIVEAIALHVQRAIDARAQKAKDNNNPMPISIESCSDHILITLGQVRHHHNKLEAKATLLNSIGKALDSLGKFTGSIYPTLFQLDGTQINNHEIKIELAGTTARAESVK